MAENGDTITFTFSGAKETEDISSINTIVVDRMDGADGGDGNDTAGGSGGLIENTQIDVSSFSQLQIFVGGTGDLFGRSDGGNSSIAAGRGGGSTEIYTDSNTTFLAAADGGGGGEGARDGGGGGARGGVGGSRVRFGTAGKDAEGTGFGGDGADARSDNPGGEGGQELNSTHIIQPGTQTKGGSKAGAGEIQVSFFADNGATSAPAAPTNLTVQVQ
jgi:hypothetical protein